MRKDRNSIPNRRLVFPHTTTAAETFGVTSQRKCLGGSGNSLVSANQRPHFALPLLPSLSRSFGDTECGPLTFFEAFCVSSPKFRQFAETNALDCGASRSPLPGDPPLPALLLWTLLVQHNSECEKLKAEAFPLLPAAAATVSIAVAPAELIYRSTDCKSAQLPTHHLRWPALYASHRTLACLWAVPQQALTSITSTAITISPLQCAAESTSSNLLSVSISIDRLPARNPDKQLVNQIMAYGRSNYDSASDNEDESSFSSTSTMDSDFEIPMALKNLRVWSNERVSAKLTQTISSMTSIRESESMRFSMVTANKWKKQGYHPYKPDASGYTALHRAAKRGDATVVTSLLAMYDGKPLDLASMKSYKQEQIALHIAAKYGNLEAVRLLSTPEFRTLVTQPDRNGNTPLHFAATSNTPSAPAVVAHLLLKGADPTTKNQRDVFPIIAHVLTAQDDDPEIVRLLMKHGSDPNTIDAAGNTALHIAVSQGLWKIAACLVREHASMTIRNNEGVLVLDILSPAQLGWLAKFIVHPPEWVPYSAQKSCMACSKKFSLLVRRHHCRLCGRICCGPCSRYKRKLPFTDANVKNAAKARNQLVKVCSTCITVREANDDDVSWASTQPADRLIASDSSMDFDDY